MKNKGGLMSTIFLMKNRRGSHVGMILSFVIFITFIVFLYSVIRPAVTTGEEKKTTLDYIEKKIEENTSAEFASISIKIEDSTNPSTICVNFSSFFPYSMISPRMIVKNESGDIQNAYYNISSDFDGFRLYRGNKDNLFFKVYYSPEFDKLPAGVIEPCTPVDYIREYNITSMNSGQYLFEKKVYELVDYYKNNYEKLKSELNVPTGSEFGFDFTQSNGTKFGVGNVSKSVSVYAGETPIQYIDEKANILSGFINVKVW